MLTSIAKRPIGTVVKGIVPYLVIMLGLLVFITYVPDVSPWLPDLVYGKPR